MKKVIAGLSIAALAAVAMPAFANNTISKIGDDSAAKIFNKVSTWANVTNMSTAVVTSANSSEAKTGNNTIFGKDDAEDNAILTGDAVSGVELDNKVNTTLSNLEVSSSCDCLDNSITEVDDDSYAKIYSKNKTGATHTNFDTAVVTNLSGSSAKTGGNEVKTWGDASGNGIGSGNALSAIQEWNMVNTKSIVTKVNH